MGVISVVARCGWRLTCRYRAAVRGSTPLLSPLQRVPRLTLSQGLAGKFGAARCAAQTHAVNGSLERGIAVPAVTGPVLLAALGVLNLGAAFYVRKAPAQGAA
jgi:hypothetical protein